MGLKMSKAYHKGLKRNILLQEATEDMKEYLLCKTATCRTPVSFTLEHNKKYKDETITVSRYFRLRTNNSPHVESCQYNTAGQIAIIARESEDDVFKAFEEGKHNFRLNVIAEALRYIQENEAPGSDVNKDKKPANPNKKYINSGKLDNYLSTMKKIMMLRAMVENSNDIKSSITLEYRNKKIKWSNFYYEPEHFHKAFSYLNTGQVEHPLCLEGEIKEIVPGNEKFPFYTVKYKFPKPLLVNGIKQIVAVELIIRNFKILEYLQQNNGAMVHIAAYSKFSVRASLYSQDNTSQEVGKRNTVQFLNIKGNLFHISQLALY